MKTNTIELIENMATHSLGLTAINSQFSSKCNCTLYIENTHCKMSDFEMQKKSDQPLNVVFTQ